MRTARDIMHTPAPTVSPETTAKELYAYLHDNDLDGACVVVDGKLTGVVTSMDLVYKEKKIHMPTFFFFLDAVIPTSDPRKAYDEVLKIAGAKVADFSSTKVISVGPETAVAEVASLMVDKHLTIVPVMDGETLVGMVTKQDVLKAAFG